VTEVFEGAGIYFEPEAPEPPALPPVTYHFSRLAFPAVYLLLAAAVAAAAFLAGGATLHPVRHETVTRTVAPKDAAGIEKAWGTPDQSIPGEQINPNLQGLTCDVYQSQQVILCH
jgi:hypothetical protein